MNILAPTSRRSGTLQKHLLTYLLTYYYAFYYLCTGRAAEADVVFSGHCVCTYYVSECTKRSEITIIFV